MTAGSVVLVCRDCWEEFDDVSSPDLERCEYCAEDQAWREGAALAGKSAYLAGPGDLTDLVPIGHDRMEA